MKRFKIVFIKKKSLDALPEYSCTLPTGTTIGKKWKRDNNSHIYPENRKQNLPEDWYVCEFVKHEDPELVGITIKKAIII